ncbi:MAG: SMC family ATPase [Chloroflexi bacterium]|nr:SMC family ATPase [Chloroflexota bacterium]
MIPVKLTLRNFMPYRNNVPPLDFAGIHTASICGANGSGKSSIIDAITWALWGQTRAGARNHDELIHSRENETHVEFDFQMGEQLYRVIRRHARPKRRQGSGQSSLDLFAIGENGMKALSGDRIGETQRRVSEILRMDYETFVNSAYIRQGHADQFTIAEPSERKRILANILGLSRYDELEEKARDFARQRESQKATAESAIKDVDRQLGEKPAAEARLAETESQLFAAEEGSREQEARLNELRQKREQLEAKQQELVRLEQNIARTQRMVSQMTAQAEQHRSRIREYEDLRARRAEIEDGYARLVEARRQNEELNEKLGLLVKLNERKNHLENIINKAQHELTRQYDVLQDRSARLDTEYRTLPQLKSGLLRVQSELSRLSETEKILDAKKQAGRDMQARIHSLETDNLRLGQEIKELGEKLDLLVAGTDARCPLCDSELGTDGIHNIRDKYVAEKEENLCALKLGQDEAAVKKRELSVLESETTRLETQLNRERTSLQTEAGVLARQIAEAEKAGAELTEAAATMQEIEERLGRKDYAPAEQDMLRRIAEELGRLGYDQAQQEEIRRELTGLEQWEGPQRKLEEANSSINRETELLFSIEQAVRELHLSLETDSQRREELAAGLDALPQLVRDAAQAEADLQRSNALLREAQKTVSSIRGRLEYLAQLEIAKQENQTRLSQAGQEAAIYKELAEAFGKNGVQALLIEMALPEFQDEANQLLSRMTDNRMHVTFKTQGETKKGDVRETLDIEIADELGTRSYEMFSGGEAFRINFAIRIALSRLLARRAGTPLRTLIIDEGFGTQDSAGLEKLKEAISSIQDDFDRILVITHVEELRDAFPTRIDVVKTPEGSMIEIGA